MPNYTLTTHLITKYKKWLKKIKLWILKKLDATPKKNVIVDHDLLTYYLMGVDFDKQYPHIEVINKSGMGFMQKMWDVEKEIIIKFEGNTPDKVKINSITIKD